MATEREKDGRLKEGSDLNPSGHFKPGNRGQKACHEAEWLKLKHWGESKTVAEMAREAGVTAGAIRYWMKVHRVPRWKKEVAS